MSITERIEIQGHLLDDGSLSRVLSEILGAEADYVIERIEVGKREGDESSARIAVTTPDDESLQRVLNRLQQFGANLAHPGTAVIVEVDVAGSFPEGFYSSTNFETEVLVDGDNWRIIREREPLEHLWQLEKF